MEAFGAVSAVKLVRDHNTGVNRGIAFIDYSSIDGAKNLIRSNADPENPKYKGKLLIDGFVSLFLLCL